MNDLLTDVEMRQLIKVEKRPYVRYMKKNGEHGRTLYIDGIKGDDPRTVYQVLELNTILREEVKVPSDYKLLRSKPDKRWQKTFIYDSRKTRVETKRVPEWRQKHYWIQNPYGFSFVAYVKRNVRKRPSTKFTVTVYTIPSNQYMSYYEWDHSSWQKRRQFYHEQVLHINVNKVFVGDKKKEKWKGDVLLLYVGVNHRVNHQYINIHENIYTFEAPNQDMIVKYYAFKHGGYVDSLAVGEDFVYTFNSSYQKSLFHPDTVWEHVMEHLRGRKEREWYIEKYGQHYQQVLHNKGKNLIKKKSHILSTPRR